MIKIIYSECSLQNKLWTFFKVKHIILTITKYILNYFIYINYKKYNVPQQKCLFDLKVQN